MKNCLSPLSIPRPHGGGSSDRLSVPCGKCYNCLANLRAQWQFRLEQQLNHSANGYFVTLTYSDDLITNLSKSEIQLFLKRLRIEILRNGSNYYLAPKVPQNASKVPKIKYYLVGEYGTQTKRPHYHAIMFNFPEFSGDMISQQQQVHKLLTNTWKNGFIHIGRITPASIGYTLKYQLKRYEQPEGLEPLFSLISKGIGKNYITIASNYHTDGQIFHATYPGGKKTILPRYYRDKIFSDYEKRKHAMQTTEKLDIDYNKEFERISKFDNFFEREILTAEQQLIKHKNSITNNERL